MNKLVQFTRSFVNDEEGAQVIEYGLLIAVVSLVLIVLLGGLADSEFQAMITAVGNCLTGNACTWGAAPTTP